jgi:hypothetical protein
MIHPSMAHEVLSLLFTVLGRRLVVLVPVLRLRRMAAQLVLRAVTQYDLPTRCSIRNG